MRRLAALVTAFSIVSALSLIAGARDDVSATTFAPDYLVTISNSAPSANSNFEVSIEVDSPHSLPSTHISFIPPEWGVADDASVPNGARVGGVGLSLTESMNNGPCSSQLSVGIDLFDATTDTTNVLDNTPTIPDPLWPGFADSDANNLEDAIDQYPSFLNTLFPDLTPRARSFGWVDSSIATINRVVNVLVFDPGTDLPGTGGLDPALGYPVVLVLQDPTATPDTGPVTDACSYYEVLRQDRGITADNFATAANEGGFVYRTNPDTDGDYTFVDYAMTRRDFDNDGIENHLDTCVTVATPDWEPRISDPIHDPDGDGLPGQDDVSQSGEQLLPGSGCDPTPLTADDDPDVDGYPNRLDNCPLVANPDQADADGDGIGDACDVVVTAADGHVHEICVTADISIGAGGTPSSPTCPVLVTDQDNDGFSDDVELHVGTDPNGPCGFDGWPADLVSEGFSENKVDIQDFGSFAAPVRILGTDPGDPDYDVRWDLVPGATFGHTINIQDMGELVVVVPPMLEGPRAFNGPQCPYGP